MNLIARPSSAQSKAQLYNRNWDELPFFKKKFYGYLSNKTPSHIKRLIFITSLMGIIEEKNRIDSKKALSSFKRLFVVTPKDRIIAKNLNEVLNLSNTSDSSLILPMVARSFIWGEFSQHPYIEIDHQQIALTEFEKIEKMDPNFRFLTAYLISIMPIWLLYGSYGLIHHDVVLLLKEVATNLKNSTAVPA
jgi:hypothetical protein